MVIRNCAFDFHDFFHYLQLVEINRTPRIKLSEDVEKVTIPGRKQAYRLFGADGQWPISLWMGSVSFVCNLFAIFAPGMGTSAFIVTDNKFPAVCHHSTKHFELFWSRNGTLGVYFQVMLWWTWWCSRPRSLLNPDREFCVDTHSRSELLIV